MSRAPMPGNRKDLGLSCLAASVPASPGRLLLRGISWPRLLPGTSLRCTARVQSGGYRARQAGHEHTPPGTVSDLTLPHEARQGKGLESVGSAVVTQRLTRGPADS